MASNPFLNRGNPKDKGRAGRLAEVSTSKRLNGRLQPGSGALAGAKGDVKVSTTSHDFLIENKTSMGSSFSVKQDHLLKVYQEALETNRNPALAFQFVTEAGKSEKRDRWVCIPEHIFQELLGD